MTKTKIGFADELAELKEAHEVLKTKYAKAQKRIAELELIIAKFQSEQGKALPVVISNPDGWT